MTRKVLIYLGLIIILSVGFYHLSVRVLPNIIFSIVQSKSLSKGLVVNEVYYPALSNETSRTVVMPNPDFLYVACFYDVSASDYSITGKMPDSTYWSVAFYEPNTVNFYVKNDQQYTSDSLNLILTRKELQTDSNTEVVQTETPQGFMLIRILMTKKEELARFEQFQKSVRFEEIRNGDKIK